MTKNILAKAPEPTSDALEPIAEIGWSRELVRLIAKDVGEAVATHIELMYPSAVAATPSTFKTSVRNCVFNEIMAAVDVSDAGRIEARLKDRQASRRRLKAAYRKLRETDEASAD
ncbi:hypothetical protein XI06_20170 [Bradyrhizobium sp. CCBAU 11434]|uniref:hypothetical protein n=1 Tax=Bradyrhizobium sp. CCBAU 11434 TaxID=1630885 RepID=UPI002305D84B|nr:hypothetical protein [Bradyrhizobium sp. CCBAU 11434]MDA9522536.1 hypothetical protein [Bradyrhizobium sp. CCBAU 11434]